MARSLDADLVAEKNKLHQTSPWVWLLEIVVSDAESVRIAAYQQDVTFNSKTYYAFPFVVSELRQNAEGQLPTLTLTIPNVTREIQVLLDANSGLTRKKVWVRLVHSDHLANADAVIEEKFSVMQAVATAEAVSFELGRVDLFDTEAPKRKYRRDTCGFVYKDEFSCGYTGNLATCDKTLEGPNGCSVHGDDEVANGLPRLHPKRFGGFPGIPKQRS